MTNGSSVLEFFLLYLPDNLLTEFSAYLRESEAGNARAKVFFRYFCSNQRSIKKLKIDLEYEDYFVDGIKLLSLDELTIANSVEKGVKPILEHQKRLKKLTFETMNLCENDFEEISKLLTLKLEDECWFTQEICNFKLLKNLKNLKELNFGIDLVQNNFYGEFCALKNDSVEILRIPGHSSADYFENISINLPNLKILQVDDSIQKLNLIAKFFPRLEKLSVEYQKSFLICEFETGIVNENLRKLSLEVDDDFCENNEPDFSTIFNIFPKLEDFEFECKSLSLKSSKKFFENFFDKKPKLKIFKLSRVPVKNCLEVIESLKIFTENHEIFELGLCFNHEISSERESFEKIENIIENQFKVVEKEINEYHKMSFCKIVKI